LFLELANSLLDKEHPGLHNQAIMEFGAMLCKPKNPDCNLCPLRVDCHAFNYKEISSLPKKLKKAKIRERFLNYIVVTEGGTILMNKRDEKDIWANMHDLPMFETPDYLSPEAVISTPDVKDFFGDNIRIINVYPLQKHVLTHQHLHVQFIHIANKPIKLGANWFYANLSDLSKLAMPKVIFVFMNNLLLDS
jgi:A/G-specific adenine glycosylase